MLELIESINFGFSRIEKVSFFDFYSLIVLIPLFTSFCSLFFFQKFNKVTRFVTILGMFSSFSLSLCAFGAIALKNQIKIIPLFHWIQFYTFNVEWCFLFDSLSISMCVVVTTVSLLVHIYSCEYMKFDPNFSKFMAYLSLFTFFMLILVTSNNFLQLFLGWEGVGLCSFLLISFWNTRVAAVKAALKAIIMNRIGDFALLFGIALIYNLFQSIDYSIVFSLVKYFINEKFIFLNIQIHYISFICFCLFIGAVGKSAQLGLHTWLPDAMEGPTPVSALIHAATMVTAGIYLIIRCSFIFEFAPKVLVLMTIWGAMTAFFAATIGLVQNDIKKVIAYSTCSQLGYMMFACGLSGYHIAFFHLVNHAFFKALLFLCAGVIIHALADEQDMRKMGGLFTYLPYTYFFMVVASLSLIGFPFLSGYYSKDLILELAYSKSNFSGNFAYFFGICSAFCTAFYSWRLLSLTFFFKYRGSFSILKNIHEAPSLMFYPLIFLFFGSVFSGIFLKDLFVGFGSNFFNQSIYYSESLLILIDIENIGGFVKSLPFFVSLFGIIFAMYLNSVGYKKFIYTFLQNRSFYLLYVFLVKKWYFDIIYSRLSVQFLYFCDNSVYRMLDKGFLEFYGPETIGYFSYFVAKKIKEIQNGSLVSYYIYFFVAFLIFLSFYLVKFLSI